MMKDMMPLIILAAIAGLPVLLAFLFRVNSVMLCFGVMAGSLLQRAFGDSASLALSMAFRDAPTTYIADLVLLGLPVLLTVFFLRKTLAHANVIIQLLPLLSVGVGFAALAWPLLPYGVQHPISQSQFGASVTQAQDVAVGAMVVLNLLLAWRVYRHRDDSKHHR